MLSTFDMSLEDNSDSKAALEDDIEACNLPWAQNLNAARIVEKNWIVGTTSDENKVKDIIDEYCYSLPCDFVKSHPTTLKQKLEKNAAQSRILWQMKDIPFNGIPFSVVSHDVLKCTFSMDYHSKKRRKIAVYDGKKHSDSNESDDNSHSDRLCPAKIIVKKLMRYPSFFLPLTATKQNKLDKLKSLKQTVDEKKSIDTDFLFWLQIPLSSYHNHSFHGKDRTIHKDLLHLIKKTISEGVTIPETIKKIITEHVTQKFMYRENAPFLDDQAYYPSLQNINFVIYNTTQRKKGTYNEVNIADKRKSEEKEPKEDVVTASDEDESIPVEGPSTLEDVVQAFCSDPLPELDELNTPLLVSTLRENIAHELSRVMEIVNTSEDPKTLEYILGNLINIQFHNGINLNSVCSWTE